MFNLLNSELFRMAKRTQSWLLFLITAVLTALTYFGFTFALRFASGPNAMENRSDATFESFRDFGVAMGVGFFTGIMLIIIASNMMGNEFSWNTLRPLVARAPGRAGLLTSKYLALTIYTLIFLTALTLVLVIYYFIGSWIVDVSPGFSMDVLGKGYVHALELTYTNIPYMALAFMLATVFRSNAAGIAGALGLTFIEQPVWMLLKLAGDVFGKLEKFGISYSAQRVLMEGMGGDTRATLVLAVYSILFIAITYIVFLKRDVTSG